MCNCMLEYNNVIETGNLNDTRLNLRAFSVAYCMYPRIKPYCHTVQVDELVINEGLLNRPMHFIVCIDTSLGADRYG